MIALYFLSEYWRMFFSLSFLLASTPWTCQKSEEFMLPFIPFSGNKRIAGLDIGSSSLKLVEIADGPEGYSLLNFTQLPLPRGVITEGLINDPLVLTGKIKELIKQSGCKARKVVTSLSGYSVILKKIGFPAMDEESLRELISDEIEKYLPFGDMKEVNFDFQILGDSEAGPGQMEVLLAAAKKEVVIGYIEAIQKAGLEVVIMDVDSFALETMYEENYDFGPDDVVILVNIGASMTNINVLRGGMSIFTRDFSVGGNSITEYIRDKRGLSLEEAEKIKLGLLKQKGESTAGDDVDHCAESLLLEIERSVDYFRSTYPGKYIKQVLLCGGSAKYPGMDSILMQRLNIACEIANPFKNIGYDRKVFGPSDIENIGPQAAVGVGLALRRVGDK
jgi:type IV pilus assembly protein PilM